MARAGRLATAAAIALIRGGIAPHPEQGFHVKLTIDAEGSQGADSKHKVFWVNGCKPGYPVRAIANRVRRPGGSATRTAGPILSGPGG